MDGRSRKGLVNIFILKNKITGVGDVVFRRIPRNK
jgi:hypothetical protein